MMPESTLKDAHATTFGARLKWLREFKGLTIREFAARMGCDPGYLSKLETGKARNPSDRFLITLRSCFFANEWWLRDGEGDPFQSTVQVEQTKTAMPDWSDKRIQRLFALLDDLPEALATDAVLSYFFRDLTVEELRDLMVAVSKIPNLPAPARAFWFGAIGRLQGPKLHAQAKENDLTNTSGSFTDVPVKAQWPDLKKRLQKATAPIGAKTALSKILNVDPTQISQWLSDSKSAREPGGEYALQMFKWVELQERQGK